MTGLDAEELVRGEEARSRGALRLAELASIAAVVEPALLRALRLQILPREPASIEADLWFGPLVAARSIHGIALAPEVAELLRARLRDRLASPAARGDVMRARSIVTRHHETLSPALAIEERIAWLAVTGAPPEEAEEELAPALAALADPDRPELAHWAVRAWERLPEEARNTRTAFLLRQTGEVIRRQPVGLAESPSAAIFDIREALAAVDQVRIGIRREEGHLELGAFAAAAAILVPDTDPRLVEVLQDGERVAVAQIPVGGAALVDVPDGPLGLRTPSGAVYELAEDAARARALIGSEAAHRVEDALVELRRPGSLGVGFFVTQDLIVAGALPDASGAWGGRSRGEEPVVVSWRGRELTADVELVEGVLAVLRLRAAPSDAVALGAETPREADDGPWLGWGIAAAPAQGHGAGDRIALRGRILDTGSFRLSGRPVSMRLALDEPSLGPTDWIALYGAPVLAADALAGAIVGVFGARVDGAREDTLGAVPWSAIVDLARRADAYGDEPRTLALGDIVQSIALAFHVGFSGQLVNDRDELYTLGGRPARLTREQYDALVRQGEWMVKQTMSEVVADPLGAAWAGLDPVPPTAHELATRVCEEVASLGFAGPKPNIGEVRFYGETEFLDVLEKDFASHGIRLERDSYSAEVVAPGSAFTAFVQGLREELARIIDAYAEWPRGTAEAPPGIDGRRASAVVSFLRGAQPGTSPFDRQGVDAVIHALAAVVAPRWREANDELVQLRVPDARDLADASTYVEVYTDRVGDVLRALEKPFGGVPFENGYAIERPSLALLRRELPSVQRSVLSDGPQLAAPFGLHVRIFEWAAKELTAALRGSSRTPVSA